MRTSTLIALAVGIAAGAVAVLMVQDSRGTAGGDPPVAADPDGSDSSISQRNVQPSQPGTPVVEPTASTPLTNEQPRPSTEPAAYDSASTWYQEFQTSSAQYAQSFQAGVWGMEPIPEFAAQALQREGPGPDVISRHKQHLADPPPEERRARAGLGSLSTAMLQRLASEDWFAQNLLPPGGRSTPRGGAVSFNLMFLPRRESPN